MRVKLRYQWCGDAPPCFGRPSGVGRPRGLDDLLYELTGRRWGEKGEVIYKDHKLAARDAATLFLVGYDVWLEPLDPPLRDPRELEAEVEKRGWKSLLRYVPRLDSLARRIASKSDFDSALRAAVDAVSEIIAEGLEYGRRIGSEEMGIFHLLAEVFTDMVRYRLEGREELFKMLEEKKPWVDGAYAAFAPWRLFARHYAHALAELGKEAGRAALEKIRGFVARRG